MFAKFMTADNKTLYINPRHVEVVYQNEDGKCTIETSCSEYVVVGVAPEIVDTIVDTMAT